MRELIDWLKESAGVWIVIGILSMVLIIYGVSRNLGFTSTRKMTQKELEMQNLKYDKYDDAWITGDEVMQTIKKYQKEVPVRIYNGESVMDYDGKFQKTNNNSKSERYINPAEDYRGKVLKEDGVVKCLVFAKKGVDLTEKDYEDILSGILGGAGGTFHDLIEKLKEMLNQLKDAIRNKTNELNGLKTEHGNLQNQYNNMNTDKNDLNNRIADLNKQIGNTNKTITSTNQDYDKLLGTLRGLGIDTSGTVAYIVEQIKKLTTGHVHTEACYTEYQGKMYDGLNIWVKMKDGDRYRFTMTLTNSSSRYDTGTAFSFSMEPSDHGTYIPSWRIFDRHIGSYGTGTTSFISVPISGTFNLFQNNYNGTMSKVGTYELDILLMYNAAHAIERYYGNSDWSNTYISKTNVPTEDIENIMENSYVKEMFAKSQVIYLGGNKFFDAHRGGEQTTKVLTCGKKEGE